MLWSTMRTRVDLCAIAGTERGVEISSPADPSSAGRRTLELAAQARAVAARQDAAAVQLYQAAHDAQAETQAALGAIDAARLLHEHVEDLRQHLLGDAHARVAHAHHYFALLARRGDVDASSWLRVLGGVGQEIRERLRQPGRVALHREARAREPHLELLGPRLEEWAGDLHRLGDHLADRKRQPAQRDG
jgi:hypothetical protein